MPYIGVIPQIICSIADRHENEKYPVFGCRISWIFIGLMVLSVFMGLSVSATFTERIELGENELRITRNFQRTVVPRANIEKVTWAKGCGALLLLKNGGSIRLPEVGENSQGLCNSIRAWIKAA